MAAGAVRPIITVTAAPVRAILLIDCFIIFIISILLSDPCGRLRCL
jgi:hypothetical protein